MNLPDAMAFVASHVASTLSSDPLAILVPGHLGPTKDLVIEHLTLPVVFREEPILVPASLLQLGDQDVKYEFQGPNIKIDTTDSTVLEIHLDSQRCPQWSSKTQAIRYYCTIDSIHDSSKSADWTLELEVVRR